MWPVLCYGKVLRLQPWLTFLWTTFCPCFYNIALAILGLFSIAPIKISNFAIAKSCCFYFLCFIFCISLFVLFYNFFSLKLYKIGKKKAMNHRLAWFFLYRFLSLSNPKCTKVHWTTLRNPFSKILFFTLVLCKKCRVEQFTLAHLGFDIRIP